MAREIKFRAWDGEGMVWNGLYVENGYLVLPNETIVRSNAKKLVWMQFTGVKDKNGVEIYEGDILVTSNFGGVDEDAWDESEWGYAVVEVDTTHGMTIRVPGERVAWSWDDEESVFALKYCEVIGNIYENPDLLTKKDV